MMYGMATAAEEQEAETRRADLEAVGIQVTGLGYTQTQFTFLLRRLSDVRPALAALPAKIGEHVVQVELHTRRQLLVFDRSTRHLGWRLLLARVLNRGDATAGYR